MSIKGWLILVLVFTIATRLYALDQTHGMIHTDSLYQYIEPAFIKISGYGLVPWEYVDGIRSWFFPGIIYIIFKIGMLAGIVDTTDLIFIMRALMSLISILLVYATYVLGCKLYDRRVGLLSAFFVSSSGFMFIWSARIMPEVPTMLAVVLGFYFLVRGLDGGRLNSLASGIIFGIAFMLKFNSALLLVPIAIYLIADAKIKNLGYLLVGFAIMVAVQGLIDVASGSSFLHSPYAFFVLNLVENKSSIFGTKPPVYYLIPLILHVPIMFFLPWSFEKKRLAGLVWGSFLFYFIVFSMIPHKELRFLFSILPLFFIICARGLSNLMDEITSSFADNKIVGLSLGLLVFAAISGQLMIFYSIPDYWSGGWTPFYENLQATAYVGAQDDAVGLAYSIHWYFSGLYTYLGKDIPAYHIVDWEFISSPQLNDRYVIPHRGFNTTSFDKLGDIDVNYVIISNVNETVNLLLEKMQYTRVKEFKNVTVYKR